MADSRLYCPHCEALLSRKAYDAHKRLFYDDDNNKWIKLDMLTAEEEHLHVAQTEQAMEYFDFDADCPSPDQVQEIGTSSNEMDCSNSPPPLIDFTLGDAHAGGNGT